MRLSNEEFTNEVFRRSDVYITKRKKRTRIVASCIPVVLCVSVLVMSQYPVMESADQAAPEHIMEDAEVPNGYSEENEYMGVDGNYASVPDTVMLDGVEIVSATIEQDGANCIVVDLAYMEELVRWIDEYEESITREEAIEGNLTASEYVTDNMGDKATTNYVIVLLDANGQEIRFEFPNQMQDASKEEMETFLKLIEEIVSK